MGKLNSYLQRIIYWTCSGLMLSMAILIFCQVVARYVFSSSLTWSEELGKYIFIWLSFIGMAAAAMESKHVALDILPLMLKGNKRRILVIFNGLCISVFAIALIYSGIKMMQLASRQTSPALKLTMSDVYLVLPLGGALLLYFIIRQILQEFKKPEFKKTEREQD